jgi:hypothetical protein
MNSTFASFIGLKILIAHRESDRHLLETFSSLKVWFDDITVVGSTSLLISKEIHTQGGDLIESDSNSIHELWEKGIQSKSSPWHLLLESKEYFSTVLKQSIEETLRLTLFQSTWFPIKRNFF